MKCIAVLCLVLALGSALPWHYNHNSAEQAHIATEESTCQSFRTRIGVSIEDSILHLCSFFGGVCYSAETFPPCCVGRAVELGAITPHSTEEVAVGGQQHKVFFYAGDVGGCFHVEPEVSEICFNCPAPACAELPTDKCLDNVVSCEAGECVCKAGFTGADCCACLTDAGYYRPIGSQECLPCDCCTTGTIGGSNVCSGSGVCQCAVGFSGDKCCNAPKCMALPPLVNGEVSWNALTVGSVASYVCDEGYVLDGTPQRDCVQDTVDTSRADWNLQAPTCQPVECDPLEVIENGEVEVSGLVPNSVADYMCTEGFVLIGQERRVCEHVDKTSTRGEWSGVEPSCQPVTCEELPDIENGGVDWDGLVPTSVAEYECDDGHVLVGQERRVCEQVSQTSTEGEWSGEEPSCQPVECDPLEDIENGDVIVTSFTPGSEADYICDEGYVLIGQETRVCEHVDRTSTRGEWSGEEPSCQPLQCEQLADIPNGRVVTTGVTISSTATYTCNEGFVLTGTETRTCEAVEDNGQTVARWSDFPPSCQPSFPCGDKTDLYFILDTTKSLKLNTMCLQAYTLMEIVAGMNIGSGTQQSQAGLILYPAPTRGQSDAPATFAFQIGMAPFTTCGAIIDQIKAIEVDAFSGVFQFGYNPRFELRGEKTLPQNTLDLLAQELQRRGSNSDRRTVALLLTDGQHHENGRSLEAARSALPASLDLIAAGYMDSRSSESESDFKDDLNLIAGNPNNVVFARETVEFVEEIVILLKEKGILCEDEARNILTRIRQNNFDNAQKYCSCLQNKVNPFRTCNEQLRPPQCQAKASSFLDNGLLEKEIIEAVERVLAQQH